VSLSLNNTSKRNTYHHPSEQTFALSFCGCAVGSTYKWTDCNSRNHGFLPCTIAVQIGSTILTIQALWLKPCTGHSLSVLSTELEGQVFDSNLP